VSAAVYQQVSDRGCTGATDAAVSSAGRGGARERKIGKQEPQLRLGNHQFNAEKTSSLCSDMSILQPGGRSLMDSG
jgi:hypothetical protein